MKKLIPVALILIAVFSAAIVIQSQVLGSFDGSSEVSADSRDSYKSTGTAEESAAESNETSTGHKDTEKASQKASVTVLGQDVVADSKSNDKTASAEASISDDETGLSVRDSHEDPAIDSSIEASTNASSAIEVTDNAEPGIRILVDLSDQHMTVYDGDVIVLESGIVSGTANTGRATPTGDFTITQKAKHATLMNNAHSDFWMRFCGGCGLHDATWRSDDEFGTDEYLTNGSHGCINLPYDAAKQLYDLVEVGTPITVEE